MRTEVKQTRHARPQLHAFCASPSNKGKVPVTAKQLASFSKSRKLKAMSYTAGSAYARHCRLVHRCRLLAAKAVAAAALAALYRPPLLIASALSMLLGAIHREEASALLQAACHTTLHKQARMSLLSAGGPGPAMCRRLREHDPADGHACTRFYGTRSTLRQAGRPGPQRAAAGCQDRLQQPRVIHRLCVGNPTHEYACSIGETSWTGNEPAVSVEARRQACCTHPAAKMQV